MLINGIASPLIYVSTGQVNAIVPYNAGDGSSANIQVLASGLQAKAWTVPLAPSSSSIFTSGGTGIGQGAVLNADNSINSASNPAARGSVIQIFGTAEGKLPRLHQQAPSLPLPRIWRFPYG